MVRDKNLNVWQASILLFILLFANKILVLPSLLYDGANVEAFFIPVLLFVLEMGLIFLYYKIKTKFPSQSFAEILRVRFGKIIAKIVFAFFMLFFFSKAVLLYNVTYVFFKDLIYKEADSFMFLLCFLPIINHLAFSGLRVMGRTAQLFFPVVVIITLFCIVVGIFDINSNPLFFETTASAWFLTVIKHTASFGDAIFLFVFMDKIDIKKGQWKILFSLSGVAMVLVVAVIVVFIFSYTYTAFMHPYAIFEIMAYVKEYGGLGRIDIISMIVIVIFTYFHLAIYLKIFMSSFGVLFGRISDIYGVLSFNFLFVLIVWLLISNIESAVFFGERIATYLSIFSFIIIPFVNLVLLTFKSNERRRE